MSVTAMNWAWEQNLYDPAAPRSHHARKMVLLVLADKADRDGHSWPGRKLIGRMAGLHPSTVTEHLGWLEGEDYLVRHRRHRANGSRTSDEYTLNLGRQCRPSDNVNLGRLWPEPRSPLAGDKVAYDGGHPNRKRTTSEPPVETSSSGGGGSPASTRGKNPDDDPPPPAEPEPSEPQDEAAQNGSGQGWEPDDPVVAACRIAMTLGVDVRQVEAVEWKRGVADVAWDAEAGYVHTGGEEGLQRLLLFDRHRAAGRNVLSAKAQANAPSADLLPLPAFEEAAG